MTPKVPVKLIKLSEALRVYGTQASICRALGRRTLDPVLIHIYDETFLNEYASYILMDNTATSNLRRSVFYVDSRWIGSLRRKLVGETRGARSQRKLREGLAASVKVRLRAMLTEGRVEFVRVIREEGEGYVVVASINRVLVSAPLPDILPNDYRVTAVRAVNALLAQLPADVLHLMDRSLLQA